MIATTKPRLSELSAGELRHLIGRAQQQLQVAVFAECGANLAARIKGHESAKRAIVVAAVQRHSMAIYGPEGSGKSMLCALAGRFGVSAAEILCCPCGCFTDPTRPCRCTPSQIERHWVKARKRPEVSTAEIHIEAPRVQHRQMEGPRGTDESDMRKQLAGVLAVPYYENLDESACMLLRQAVRQIGLLPSAVITIKAIAASVAALDGDTGIQAHHVAEAIQYRRFDRPFGKTR